MAGVLHGSARTTPRVRSELQASKETTRTLAARHPTFGKNSFFLIPCQGSSLSWLPVLQGSSVPVEQDAPQRLCREASACAPIALMPKKERPVYLTKGIDEDG